MNTLIFDLETDGLLDVVTKVHCLCIMDVQRSTTTRYSHQPGGNSIADGLRLLEAATLIVGHNIVGFDLPVIRKLYPNFRPLGQQRDTILCTRLMWPDLKESDFALVIKNKYFPKNLIGSHSLKAWGYRVNELKGDFKESKNDWSHWTQEMEDYCVQDVSVTFRLWETIRAKQYSEVAVELEHRFAAITQQQEVTGFAFDSEAALKLAATLQVRRAEVEDELRKVFTPTHQQMKSCVYLFEGAEFSTKFEAAAAAAVWAKENKTTKASAIKRITEGSNKVKEVPFNPGSRDQIAARFIKQGWKPEEYTPDGRVKVDEGVLDELNKAGYKEAAPLLDYLLVSKRLGQVAEGTEAWLKLVRPDGRMHGRITTNGAVTGRCTHSKPNMAQVPNHGSKYGAECRALFGVPAGKKLVGCDASGLELRCLAHYMARYDGGAYMKVLLDGDIHTENQKAAGLPTRDNAKTFIYAFLYGAGDAKIGSIIGKGPDEGGQIKEEFLRKTPALKSLREAVEFAAEQRGSLVGLDGRILPIRAQHAALNMLLQSAGALVMKQATILTMRYLTELGYASGREFSLVAHVHDEMQFECQADKAEAVGKAAVQAIRDAGKAFKFRCPLDGAFKIGNNWAETH